MSMQILFSLVLILDGALSVLAFSPFHYFYLIYFTLAILFASWSYASPRQAMWRGLFFGLGFFGAGISWVYVSIHTFGNIAWPLAILLTFCLILLLSVFIAAQGYLLARFFPHHPINKTLLAFPSFWVIAEWLREWLFTGFPWLYIGESQSNGPLAGFTPLIGIFGTSWLTAFMAGLLIIICYPKKRYWKRYAAIISILVILFLGSALKQVNWTSKVGHAINVSLIQGNIPQSVKWDPALADLSLYRYEGLTQASWKNELIIWPENAVPLTPEDAQPFLAEINREAKQHQSTILLGIPIEKNPDQYYNSLLAVGQNQGLYFKRHLVPFGEYIPLSRYFNHLFELLTIPMTGFVEGEKHQPLMNVNNIKISPLICYEIAYSSLLRDTLPAAQLFVTVSNDAWFGNSIAAWQHLQIAQIQAIATGRPVLFGTNDGVTAIIDEKGRIESMAPRFVTFNLQGTVQARAGSTPWTILGDWPVLIFSLLCLGIIFLRARKRLRSG